MASSKPTIIYHFFNVSIRNIIDPRINFSRDCRSVRQIGIDHISIVKGFYCRCVALSRQHIIIDVNTRSDIQSIRRGWSLSTKMAHNFIYVYIKFFEKNMKIFWYVYKLITCRDFKILLNFSRVASTLSGSCMTSASSRAVWSWAPS